MEQLSRCLEIGVNQFGQLKEFCRNMGSNCTQVAIIVQKIQEDTSTKSMMETGFIFLAGSMAMLVLVMIVISILCCSGRLRFACCSCEQDEPSTKKNRNFVSSGPIPLPHFFTEQENESIHSDSIQTVLNVPMKSFATVKRA